jgi:hypothetical protein
VAGARELHRHSGAVSNCAAEIRDTTQQTPTCPYESDSTYLPDRLRSVVRLSKRRPGAAATPTLDKWCRRVHRLREPHHQAQAKGWSSAIDVRLERQHAFHKKRRLRQM